MEKAAASTRAPAGVLLLIALCLSVIVQCGSLLLVTEHFGYFDMYFDISKPIFIVCSLLLFSGASMLFLCARFSFGYVVGYAFLITVMNFIWLNYFSRLYYDHEIAGVVVAASLLLFLLPALLLGATARRRMEIAPLPFLLLVRSAGVVFIATILFAARYNFRLVGLANIYEFRNQIEFPTVLSYLINMSINVIGPFIFACQIERKRYLGAFAIAAILLMFYPVTLSKTALFAPFWLTALAIAIRGSNPKFGVVALFLLMPLLGIIAHFIGSVSSELYFATVNFRMIVIPANVLEHYLDYFQVNPTTGFCNVGLLQNYLRCSDTEQISVILNQRYALGNQNGSFLATEGVATFGVYFMPIAALLCGGIIGLGNAASNELPARFIAISGGMMPFVMNNIPMSTALLSGGYGLLIVFWALTPKLGLEVSLEMSKLEIPRHEESLEL